MHLKFLLAPLAFLRRGGDYFKSDTSILAGVMNEFLPTRTTCRWVCEGLHSQTHDKSSARILVSIDMYMMSRME